jgi:hypothetical protein
MLPRNHSGEYTFTFHIKILLNRFPQQRAVITYHLVSWRIHHLQEHIKRTSVFHSGLTFLCWTLWLGLIWTLQDQATFSVVGDAEIYNSYVGAPH